MIETSRRLRQRGRAGGPDAGPGALAMPFAVLVGLIAHAYGKQGLQDLNGHRC